MKMKGATWFSTSGMVSLAIILSMPSPVRAADEQLEEIVITGIRASYMTALSKKRDATGITDGISAEDIGRFPDLNVGEALQRIPGVQINREAESRDATVNLRGLPGTFARTTLNGGAFADPVLDGSSPLGAFETAIFSAFVVTKSPSAADQPGGLSGNIDLQIQRALSRHDGSFSMTVGSGYEETTGSFTPTTSVSYAKHFMGGRLGVFAVGAYSNQDFRRDSITFTQYTPLSKTTTPDYATRYGTDTIQYPSDIRRFTRFTQGDRYSFSGGVEFKPGENWDINFTGLYTRRDYGGTHTLLQDIDLRGAATIVNPTGPAFGLPDGNRYVNRVDFTNPRIYTSYRSEPVNTEALSLIGDAEYKTDKFRWLATGVYSRGNNSQQQTQIDYRKQATVSGNGIRGNSYSGGGNYQDFALSLTPSPVTTVTPGPWTIINANEMSNPQGDTFIVAGTEGFARTELYSAQNDFEFNVNKSVLQSVQFGVRYEHSLFDSEEYRSAIYGVRTDGINSSLINMSNTSNFFGGLLKGADQTWPTINYANAIAALRPVTLAPGQTLTKAGFVNDASNGGVGAHNFSTTNKIYSTYAMAKLEKELFGIVLRGNAGVRYEYTDQVASSSQYDANAIRQTVTTNSAYARALPSALLVAEITEKFLVRGAYYQSFVRPQPRQVTPSTVVSGSGALYNVSLGSPGIKPFSADSYDLSFEYYNRPGGVFAAALFTKQVKGMISAETDRARLCPADGGGFGLGPLSQVGDVCQSANSFNGQPIQVNVSGSINSSNPLTVRGIEVSVQQNLDFLPGLLKNLGGILNYSFTDISGKNPNGTRAILPGVSRHSGNVVGYYEDDTLGVRLTYNYRSYYDLSAGGTFAGAARQVQERGQLDASASYKFTDRLTLAANAFNLTDEVRFEYENSTQKPRRIDYDGRTYSMSLRYAY